MGWRTLCERLRRVWRFVAEDVWDIEITSLSALHALGVKAVRVVHLVFRGFREDECPLHASALTFSTLMAIVPVLALSVALARGFGDTEETAKNAIRNAVSNWTQRFAAVSEVDAGDAAPEGGEEADGTYDGSRLAAEIDRLVERAFVQIENMRFAALGGAGLVLLIWIVIVVLGRVESSFNRVWGVTSGRSLWRRFTDYLSVVVVLPLLVVAASTVPVASVLDKVFRGSAAPEVRAFMGSGALKGFTVLLTTSLAFTFLIMFMPNARIRVLPGLTGGVVTGLLFILWLNLCAALQMGAARYGRIYGSFALVPILLVWIFMSWQIVLFGAEVAFAVQNCDTYRMEQGAHKASFEARVMLALSVLAEAGRAMQGEQQTFDVEAYAREKRVPVRFLNEIVSALAQEKMLAEISGKKNRYVLLRTPARLPIQEVIGTFVQAGVGPSALGLNRLDERVRAVLEEVRAGAGSVLPHATVQDLV